MIKRPTIYFYLHTHWDREWYLAFDTYRVSLLATVRDVIEKLESGQLPNFLLDGQSCLLEDIAEIDYSLVPRLKKLMKRGVLSAAWYVLADQMLVSGESLLRNLKLGLLVTRRFGQPALIGYCPDTFGHTEDLPRILQGFGIDNAFVWRGVPELDNGPVFWWQSKDGSRVLCYHLARGYYQASLHLAHGVEEWQKFLAPWLAGDHSNGEPAKDSYAFSSILNGALVPIGADHMAAPDNFAKAIKSAKASSKDWRLLPITLPEFSNTLHRALDSSKAEIACLESELRENSAALAYERAYMLPGVLSTRLYLKRENRLAEHRFWRLTEPFYSYLAAIKVFDYPAAELTYALKQMLRNQPHDSICGCSIDSVHDEMMQRTHSFHNLLDGLDCRAAEMLSFKSGALAPRFALGAQPVADPELDAHRLIAFNASSEGAIGPVPLTWAAEKGSTELLPVLNDREHMDVQVVSHSVQAQIFTGFGQEPSVREVEVFHGWIWLDRIPPLVGKESEWRIAPAPSRAKRIRDFSKKHELVSADERRIANEFLSVEIDPDGAVVVTKADSRKRSRTYKLGHTIRDVADGGDTYNFDPIVGDKPIVAKVKAVTLGQKGPLVASLMVTYEMRIPARLDEVDAPSAGVPSAPAQAASADDTSTTVSAALHITEDRPKSWKRSSDLIVHELTTEVSLRRGVPMVFFETSWHNQSTDHRMEVVFDTGLQVVDTFAENHFSMIKRTAPPTKFDLPVAKGTEAPLDRLACQRFFTANGQLFVNQGLPEYGVDGSSTTITILRAVSYLSRPRLRTRGGGAGPPVKTPGANSLGANRVTYAWAPLSPKGSEDEHAVESYRLAEQFEGPVRAFLCRDSVVPVEAKPFIQLDNPACRLTSMYTSDDGKTVFAHLLNVTGIAQSCLLNVGLPVQSVSLCAINEKVLSKLQTAGKSARAQKQSKSQKTAQVEEDALDRSELRSRLEQRENSYDLKFGPNQLQTIALALTPGR